MTHQLTPAAHAAYEAGQALATATECHRELARLRAYIDDNLGPHIAERNIQLKTLNGLLISLIVTVLIATYVLA